MIFIISNQLYHYYRHMEVAAHWTAETPKNANGVHFPLYNESLGQQWKTKHLRNIVGGSTLILAVNVGGAGGDGWRVSIRQMTVSLLCFALFRSASTPSLLKTTVTFRARPFILMGAIQRLGPPPQPLLSISVVVVLWQQILARLALSWLTLKKLPQKSL